LETYCDTFRTINIVRASLPLSPIAIETIRGFGEDDLDEALRVFRRSAQRLLAGAPQQRSACEPFPGLYQAARAALLQQLSPKDFFTQWFQPFRVATPGFLTAYYEPEIDARLTPSRNFNTPILSRPPDLVTLNETPIHSVCGEVLTSARRLENGALAPYPDRRRIEEDTTATNAIPLAYVHDPVELFLMQVQGSARLRLENDKILTLTYDGRNGWPYTSIGKRLIEKGLISSKEMTLELLKSTLRTMGVDPGAPGRLLMQENRSYIFFSIDHSTERQLGPIGGENCPLTPLRSIAVDRGIWCYGLPFWISGRIPWQGAKETTFERLMIAQDTGSAIIGSARADLFFGAGPQAGQRAGQIRHEADFVVFLPVESAR